MKQEKYDLTQGTVWKQIVHFAVPILLGIIFQQLYSTIDAMIIGKFAGKEAVASIEAVYFIIKLPVNFFIGLSTGATIIISQYYGAKKFEELSKTCHTAIVFAFFGGLFLSLPCILAVPFLLKLTNVPEDIVLTSQQYVRIYFSGMMFSMTYNICAGIFRAVGDSKKPLYVLVFANVLNIILDFIFIVFLELGVVGAALATVVSQLISMLLLLAMLTRTTMSCRIHWTKLKIAKHSLREILTKGLPVGIQSMIFPISNTVILSYINMFGVNAIAAWAVCGKLDFLVWNIADALGSTVATFVSQNHGAKKFSRAKEGVVVSSLIALSSTGIVALILYYFNGYLSYIFINDAEVIGVVGEILNLIAPLYILYTLVEILPSAIRGTGETVKPMIISVFGTCFCRLFWVWFVVSPESSLLMVLACYPISWGVTSLAFLIYYRYHFKQYRTNRG